MKIRTKILLPVIVLIILSMSVSGFLTHKFLKENLLMHLIQKQEYSQLDTVFNVVENNNQIKSITQDALDKKHILIAKGITQIIKNNPSYLQTDHLTNLAEQYAVDEIHVVNDNGILVNGTVSDFFGFDMNTTEQTKPFLKILEDKNFTLAQEPQERGVDKALFQYIGVARQDQPGIVQIGIRPQAIEEITGKMKIQTLIEKTQIGVNGYAFVVDMDGNVIAHKDSNRIGENIMKDEWSSQLYEKGMDSFEYEENGETLYAAFKQGQDMVVVVAYPENEFITVFNEVMMLSLGIFAAAIILLVAVLLYSIRMIITKPLKKLTEVADHIALGNVNMNIKVNTNDEIGSLERAFETMVSSIKTQAEVAGRIAAGEENIDVTLRSDKDILSLGLKDILENNDKLMNEIRHLTDEAARGNLKVKANEEVFDGSWQKLVEGLNNLVENVENPFNRAGMLINQLADGEKLENVNIAEYEGEFKVLIQNVLNVDRSLNTMLDEIQQLILEAVNGNLKYRAKMEGLNGSYGVMVEGINETLDAIIEPIQEASETLQEMSNGALSARVTGDYQGDHAQIKNALNSMGETIQGYINEIANNLSHMADKDLTHVIERDYLGDFSKLKVSINHITNQLSDILFDINASAEQVDVGASQVASAAQHLSAGATEQASSVEEISASITQVTEQIKENANSAIKANDISVTAKEDAKKGNAQMVEMLASMKDIKEASRNISNIIKVIDDIAFQTNILSLNAAVEAARAGDNGKGFAVVAQEVRNLAARSAHAAKETGELIENSIKKVDNGFEMANNTAKALEKIVQGVENSVNLVSMITDASKEQSTAMAQVSEGVEQVSQVTQQNTATAEESASASEEMASQVRLLKEMIQEFEMNQEKQSTTYSLDSMEDHTENILLV